MNVAGEPFNPHFESCGFWPTESVARLPNLSAQAKLLYWRLTRFAGKDGACWPSQATLQAELAMSESALRRAIRDLENCTLIRCIRGTGKQSSWYVFLWHSCFSEVPKVKPLEVPQMEPLIPPEVPQMTPQGCQIRHPRGSTDDTSGVPKMEPKLIIESFNESISPPSPSGDGKVGRSSKPRKSVEDTPEFLAWFEGEFWKLYPRREDKKTARSKLSKIATTPAMRTRIIDGLKRQLPELRQRELRHVKLPATWINGECWDNEPLKLIESTDDGLARLEEATRKQAEEDRQRELARVG